MTQIHFEKEGKRPSLRAAMDAGVWMGRFWRFNGFEAESSGVLGKPYHEVVYRATELAVGCIRCPIAESRFRENIATEEDKYIRDALEYFRRRAKNLIGLRNIVFRLGDVVGRSDSDVPLDYESLVDYGIMCCEEFDRLRKQGWTPPISVFGSNRRVRQCLEWLRTKKPKKGSFRFPF